MEKVKFKFLFDFQKKSNLKASDEDENGTYPFYTSSSIITKRTNKPIYNQISLVIGNGGSANIHFADIPFSATSHCYIAVAKTPDVNTKFVYYYLSTNLIILERGFKGAGLKNISSKYIEEIEIPLPDLETQNKVVAILDKAKIVLDKREETIKEYEKLLKNTFLEMFGDPVKNKKGWDKIPIQKICKNIVDCPHSTPNYLETKSEFPCIRTSEIKNGNIVWESMKYISEESYLERIARLKPEENDIIFGREGTVGEALLIPSNLNISLGQRVMLFRVNEELIRPMFFWAQLVSDGIQFEIHRRVIGATVKRINIGDLVQIPFIIPPMELQLQFELRTEKILPLIKKIKTHFESTDNLLKSLSQQVFSERIIIDVDTELEALINAIDVEKKDEENKIDTIRKDVTFIQRLIDRLDEHEFENKEQYDKAKYVLFRMMKEEDSVKQVFKNNYIQLTL